MENNNNNNDDIKHDDDNRSSKRSRNNNDNNNSILQNLKNIFNEHEGYVINQNKFSPFIWKIKSKTKDCLVLEFSQTNIHIDSLHKCGDKSGTTLLQKIDELANIMLSLEYIFMEDISLIVLNGIEIDLAFFKILTTGESWYNSFGYVSVNYKNELNHNENLRNKKLMEVLNDINDNDDDDVENLYSNNKLFFDNISLENLYSNNKLFFDNIPLENLTIKKFFECINILIKTKQHELEDAQIETLQKLIEIIGEKKILYDRDLTKIIRTCHDISCVINGGKNKKQKTKNKKQKTKNKKQTQDK
jgi:hypothetical protein